MATQASGSMPHLTRVLWARWPHFLLAMLVLGGVVWLEGSVLARALAPAIGVELHWLDDALRVDAVSVGLRGVDEVLQIHVGQASCFVLAGVAHCGNPQGRAQAWVLVGDLWVAPTLLLACVSAWPWARPGQLAWRAALVAPAGAALLALDAPMVLWASIWGLVVQTYAPESISPLLWWADFLVVGGRYVLALLLAWAVVRAAAALAPAPHAGR